jgi:uncharacterized protein YecE (DUF72 family)
MTERVLNWAVSQLPFWHSTEQDKARLRRECQGILAQLPEDVTEAEARAELEEAITGACQAVEQRKASKEREERKASLIQQGVAEVTIYLTELNRKGEITNEEYWDSEVAEHFKACVRRELERELTGDESAREVKNRAREIIDSELE